MQGISASVGSSLAQTYATPSKSFPSTSVEQSVSGPIFQNLLKSGYVDDCVSRNDDGTYSFDLSRPDSTSMQALLARQIILNQTSEGIGHWDLTPGDLDIFKKMTGYNYVVTAGGSTFSDDQGNPPPPSAKGAIDAASSLMDNIVTARMNGTLTGNVTPDWSQKLLTDLQDAAQLGYMTGAWVPSNGFIDKLLHILTARQS